MMSEGRQRSQWMHTSSMMALTVNMNRDPKKSKPAKPSDFDPFSANEKDADIEADISILKTVFIDGMMPKGQGG